MLGVRRFADFAENLPISRNILTRRLSHLVRRACSRASGGHLRQAARVRAHADGKDLVTVMTALRQWGDRWVFGEGNEPVLVLDRRTGRPVPRLRIVDEKGAPIGGRDLTLAPGPGAKKRTTERYRRMSSDHGA